MLYSHGEIGVPARADGHVEHAQEVRAFLTLASGESARYAHLNDNLVELALPLLLVEHEKLLVPALGEQLEPEMEVHLVQNVRRTALVDEKAVEAEEEGEGVVVY